MRRRLLVWLLALLLSLAAGCGGEQAETGTQGGTGGPAGSGGGDGWMSASQAVDIAFAALPADWQSSAKLASVRRWSKFCPESSPYDVEEDDGIGSDGRQAHWVVVFCRDESGMPAQAYFVEGGKAKLVADDLATIRPDEVFDREGWVDSTAIAFRASQPVGLELRTNDIFEDVDPDLASHPLLWLADTSFGHFDVYDATTGEFIKSR